MMSFGVCVHLSACHVYDVYKYEKGKRAAQKSAHTAQRTKKGRTLERNTQGVSAQECSSKHALKQHTEEAGVPGALDSCSSSQRIS